ncbi:MAG: TIR domain-containing protein [Burkholderiaceae bacterium]|jgi:hypothetical protein|nr:TIR domain-containing protein [Burkholderiaceae bacterium]
MAHYPLFVSYTWLVQDGPDRLYSLLENYRLRLDPEFDHQMVSVSRDDPVQQLPSKKALALAIEEKMKTCICLVVLAGVFEEYKRWLDLELDSAKRLGKPIVLVEAVASKFTSAKEKRMAKKIVKWDMQELGEAIVSLSGRTPVSKKKEA